MYAHGKGIPKDEDKAVELFRKAAMQGNVTSQYNLGSIYSGEESALKDDVEAYAWLTVVNSDGNGNEAAKKALEFLQSKLTQEELTDANRRATKLSSEIEAEK